MCDWGAQKWGEGEGPETLVSSRTGRGTRSQRNCNGLRKSLTGGGAHQPLRRGFLSAFSTSCVTQERRSPTWLRSGRSTDPSSPVVPRVHRCPAQLRAGTPRQRVPRYPPASKRRAVPQGARRDLPTLYCLAPQNVHVPEAAQMRSFQRRV